MLSQQSISLIGGALPPVPAADAAQVFIDFDGTLTTADVLDQLIIRYSINERWKELERLWQLKEIGSRQCLTEELAQVRIGAAELDGFLDNIQLDPGAARLLKLLEEYEVPVTVLSDGIDHFIAKILARHGVRAVAVRSNKMSHEQDRIALSFPYENKDCEAAAGHCKCASARLCGVSGRKSIYIGDGRSDLCAARKMGCVFAKGELARCLHAEGIAFRSFATLEDVQRVLESQWKK